MLSQSDQTDFDPLAFAQALIRRPSVTPADAGALDILQAALEQMGFACRRMPFGDIDNLYARLGASAPNFCFAGHTDVVPPGDLAGWSVDPFAAEIRGGQLIGRGAADMKGAIAAFVCAVSRYLADHGPPAGSISFLITGDEEGPAVNGTQLMLPALAQAGETIDHCLVGEPTSDQRLGDIVKNGRRGSINGVVKVRGRQGHVAYPEKSANPVPVLLDALGRLRALRLDAGSPGFQPSNLEITSVDVGNPSHNTIPAEASARFNVRFNPNHTLASLRTLLADTIGQAPDGYVLSCELWGSGEAFYTEPGRLTALLQAAVSAETGAPATLSTSGGTSDARFITFYCPVAELGLKNETAHKIDEQAPVDEIETLARIYYRVLAGYFAAG